MEAMNERGKELEAYGEYDAAANQLFSSAPELPCKKHPQSSTDGICAYCLRDKLLELVICGECGEQRPSSCSCSCSSEISSSDPNSTANSTATAAELVSSRISFLIENENGEPKTNEIIQKTSDGDKDDEVFMRRSSLGNANAKGGTRRGIWNIARVFRRKRNKGDHEPEKSEILVSDLMGTSRISRSRSFCSFRAAGDRSGRYVFDNEDIGGLGVSSAARVSSSVIESAKRSCFSESEARISNFEWERDNAAAAAFVHKTSSSSSIFSWKECEFMTCGDDPRFIDLKLDLSSEAKSASRRSEFGGSFENGAWRGGFKEKEAKQHKGWRWFFKRSSKLGSHGRGDGGRNSFMY